MFNVSDGTRPCSECVWNSAEGCTKWVCEPLTRRSLAAMLLRLKALESEEDENA